MWNVFRRDLTHWLSSRSRMKDEPKASTKKLLWARWTGWGRDGFYWHTGYRVKQQQKQRRDIWSVTCLLMVVNIKSGHNVWTGLLTSLKSVQPLVVNATMLAAFTTYVLLCINFGSLLLLVAWLLPSDTVKCRTKSITDESNKWQSLNLKKSILGTSSQFYQ